MPKKLCILGHPVSHSKSPAMYNAVYQRLGLDWEYGLEDLETPEEALAFLKGEDYLSVNITTPYKPCGYEAADVLAASARLSRGVNLIVSKQGKRLGYNVDGAGCIAFLEKQGVDLHGKSVAVCGTGPTSLSIYHEAAIAGAREVLLLGRDRDRARRVVERYLDDLAKVVSTAIMLPSPADGHRSVQQAYDEATFKFGTYLTSTKAISAADVVIDATPLGMTAGDPAPFDTDLIGADQTIVDTVYGHGETALLAAARARGARAFDGAGMLVSQAVMTVTMLTEIEGVETDLGYDGLFGIMARAAGFSF